MHSTQSYAYAGYALAIGGVPLYVPAVWSMLLIHAQHLFTLGGYNTKPFFSKSIGIFLAALYILAYDFVIDVVAVSLVMRTWFLPIDAGWFGVSYGNFFGWFIVSYFFILFYNFFQKTYIGNILTLVTSLCIQSIILVGPFLLFDTTHKPIQEQPFYNNFFWIQCIIFLLASYFSIRCTIQNKQSIKGSTAYSLPIQSEMLFYLLRYIAHAISLWYVIEHAFPRQVLIMSILMIIQLCVHSVLFIKTHKKNLHIC